MPNSDPAPLTFYKAYCFKPLSPTYNEWVRLTAADLHALRERPEFEGQHTYFHLNHPIKWIRLVGVVVDFEAYPNRFIMVLDDSSGANIEITCGRTSHQKQEADANAITSHVPAKEEARMIGNTAQGYEVDLTGVDVGSVVKVKGGIGCFRGEKQMTLERLTFVRTTNEEAEAWAQNAAFRREILNKPWVISEQDERRARRGAEGHEARQRAKDNQRREKKRLLEESKKQRVQQIERQAKPEKCKGHKHEVVGHGVRDGQRKPEPKARRRERRSRAQREE